MFSFFKKKNVFNSNMNDIFIKICRSLPDKYSFLYHQVKDGIILSVKKQDAQYNKFVLNNNLLNKYEDKNGRYYAIKRIRLSDRETTKTLLALRVGYWIILGYSIENDSLLNLTNDRINIDTSNISIEFFDDNNIIKDLFSKEELKCITPNDVYEIELNGNLYYHIRDTKDGDFIAIDTNKNVYNITHDPFEIKLLSDSLLNILKDK
jgi:hypothetical protein